MLEHPRPDTRKKGLRMQGDDSKACIDCERVYPRTLFYFPGKSKAVDGLQATCKGCWARRYRPEKALLWQRRLDADEGEQVCTKCLLTFPATTEYFGPNPKCERGIRTYCRDCRKAKDAKYRAKNHKGVDGRVASNRNRHPKRDAEYIRARNREYHRRYRETHEEYVREKERSYYQQNRERILLIQEQYRRMNPEKRAEQVKRWGQDNLDKRRVYQQRRRARKILQSGEPYAADDIEQMYSEQGGFCHYCQSELAEYHIEHQTPISRGGVDGLKNIVLACPPCNISKGAKTEKEFMACKGR